MTIHLMETLLHCFIITLLYCCIATLLHYLRISFRNISVWFQALLAITGL